jgi:hypothetical protein
MSVRHVDPDTKDITETFVGAVLDEYEDNGYHDSYGYAIVWDAEKGTVHTESTWTTAYYSSTSATVDATEESIKAAKEYAAKILFKSMVEDHKVVAPGKTVKSLTKRGKAKGITGVVSHFEKDQYRRSYGDYTPKVAVVKVTAPYDNPHYGRKLWIDPDRLEVIDELTPDVETDYKQEAWLQAQESSIRSLFHPRYGALYRPSELYR